MHDHVSTLWHGFCACRRTVKRYPSLAVAIKSTVEMILYACQPWEFTVSVNYKSGLCLHN